MIDLSDSESSAPSYSSPDDDDYNTSDGDDNGDDNDDVDGDINEQDDHDSEHEKTKAVRHGFSLHQHQDHSTNLNSHSHSPKTPEGNEEHHRWLSTQPASQSSLVVSSSTSATKTKRRVSPRRNGNGNGNWNAPTGITSAIVGVLQTQGQPNAAAMDNLVIPKKKKFQQQQQQQVAAMETQRLADKQVQMHQSHQPQAQAQSQAQSQQPPMKKRKVSLSPTDSLARQLPSIRGGDDSKEKSGEVIDLLADDDEYEYETSSSSPKAFTSKRSRIAQEKVIPQRLSPSLLAAANKQQKEHVEASKQQNQQKSNNTKCTDASRRKKKETTKTPKRRLSTKVSQVSYAEEDSTGIKPASTDPLPPNNNVTPKAKEEGAQPNQNKNTTNSGRSNAKSDAPFTASESKEFVAGNTKAAVVVAAAATNANANTNSAAAAAAATQSKAKKKTQVVAVAVAVAKTAKPNSKATSRVTTVGSTKDATTPMQPQATNNATTTTTTTTKAKPLLLLLPPKKKKKKRITFEHELLQKMFLACRPYSTRDLVQLMGKTTSEASINFCLLSLIDKKWVIKKEFKSGKTRTKELYWANQESRDKKLWALECLQLPNTETIRGARFELATLQQQHKSLIKEVQSVEHTPSNQHLSTLCHIAQKEADDLAAKLELMKGRIASTSTSSARVVLHPTKGGTVTVTVTVTARKIGGGGGFNNNTNTNNCNRFGGGRTTGLVLHNKKQKHPPTTPLQLKKRINIMRDHWIKRKRKCMDFVDALADGMEKKIKDVVNKVLELETDEAEHAILPQKHVIL